MQPEADSIHRQFLAHYLESESRTIARLAAMGLVSQDPALAARYSPQPELKWRSHFEGWTTDLSAAVNLGRPEVFSSRMEWCAVAFASRKVAVSDLVVALGAFRQAVIRHVPVEDVRTLATFFEAAEAKLARPPLDEPEGEPLSRLAKSFLLAILEGERLRANTLVFEAVRNGTLMPARVAPDVLVPVMCEVGRLWHMGELSVAEEHFATTTAHSVLSQVLPLLTMKPRNGLTMLAASVEGNTHDLGIRILTDVFESEGWRTIGLGASVPVEDIANAVLDFEADLIGLSVMVPHQLTSLADAVVCAKAARPERPVKVIVGGAALKLAPEAWREMGADGSATTPDEAVVLAQSLFGLTPGAR